jgi:hypothetical protein
MNNIFSSQKALHFFKLFLKIILGILLGLAVGLVLFMVIFHKTPQTILQTIFSSVASVDNKKITKQDIDYQIQIDKCYGIENQSGEKALIEIINNLLEKEALIFAFNIKISEKDLENKSNWIDTNTKAPNILKCVKSAFGNDKKSYLNLYVSPTVVNPTLYQNFYYSKSIHRQEWNRINEILKQLANGQKIESFSEYQKFDIPKEITLPKSLQDYKDQFKEPIVLQIVKQLKNGQLWSEIVEDENSYMIIRLIDSDKDKYYVDGIVVKKKEFEPWFKDLVTKNIKISILDETLAQSIKRNYSLVWWVPLIKDK